MTRVVLVHEDVHQGAGQDEQVRQDAKKMRSVFGQKVESEDPHGG